MIPLSIQKQLLLTLYDVFDAWVGSVKFACRKECSTCCTRSATMTTLEGDRIITFLVENGRLPELAEPAFEPRPNKKSQFTTNSYIAAYLSGKSLEGAENWDLKPCPFLTEGNCSIYPVRPFSCRVFASLEPCSDRGVADMPPNAKMPPGYFGAATVLLQCIEHLDFGGRWGSIVELIAGLHNGKNNDYGLPTAPIPDFLIEPNERPLIESLFKDLSDRKIEKHSVKYWLQISRQ